MILRMAWSSMQFWQGSKGTHNIGVKDGFAHGMAKRAVLARRSAKASTKARAEETRLGQAQQVSGETREHID